MMKEDPDTTIEGLRFKTETVRGEELLKQIEVNGERDPRFLPWKEDGTGGVFRLSPFDDDPYSLIRNDEAWFSLLKLNDLVVGMVAMLFDPKKDNAVWFVTISIDENLKGLKRSKSPEEQNMRLSEQLLLEVFRFVKEHGRRELRVSTFTDEGKKRIKRKIYELGAANGITIHEL